MLLAKIRLKLRTSPKPFRALIQALFWQRFARRLPVVSAPKNGVAVAMIEHSRISLEPNVLVGKPVIRGTRLSVEFVIGLMADGWSEADILRDTGGYPRRHHRVSCLCARYVELGEGIPERSLKCAFSPTRISLARRSPG